LTPYFHISRKVAKSQRWFLKEKETVLGGPGGLSASGREASSVAGAAGATIAQRKVSLKMVLVTPTASDQICQFTIQGLTPIWPTPIVKRSPTCFQPQLEL